MEADFYPSQNDAFFAWAWRNRRTLTEIHCASPKYVILWKVTFFSWGGGEKHVSDIRRMLEISSTLIDHDGLREELKRRQLLEVIRI